MVSYLLAGAGDYSTIIMWVIVAAIVVIFGVWMFFSSKKRKKQEQEAKDLINAVKPGNKVKTIGGVCGIVVEVDSEENTFVLETGSEASGKSFIKFDKQAIYQTDAVVEKDAPKASEEATPAEEVAPEIKPAEENAEQTAEPDSTSEEDKPVLVKTKKGKK